MEGKIREQISIFPFVIVFSNTITPRLNYIAEFIGNQLTGRSTILTDNKSDFHQYDGPRINYSDQRISEIEIRIQPCGLLFENKIRDHSIECFEIERNKAFFKTEGDLGFDLFAASFYLLSRYEEYLPHKKDIYGRYAHQNSLAFRNNFLEVPLVNQWLQIFRRVLKLRFPHLPMHDSTFTFLPTYDIDEAWSYKHKGKIRTAGAVIKAFLKGNWSRIRERRKVLKGKMQDPYDSYDWMDELHQKFGLDPRYFFLVAKKTGKYDRNILPRQGALKEIIRQHAGKYKIGVHPSWQSGNDPSLIIKEKQTIEEAGGINVTSSRQHFIRFSLPQTFRYLTEADIRKDFSMGYGSINGFRASVASPFYWYDLEREGKTSLLLYPFCFMEANSFFEQKQTPLQSLEEIRKYYRRVKEINGTFICIWHNTFLGTDTLFAGWREVYEEFIKEISRQTIN